MAPQKALSLTIQDEQTLLSAYMPLLERGGIFVPTRERYELGQEVYLLLTLPGESERVPVTGRLGLARWRGTAAGPGHRHPLRPRGPGRARPHRNPAGRATGQGCPDLYPLSGTHTPFNATH